MPSTQCIQAPTFSLNGEQFYSSTTVELEVNFADSGDAADVQAYQWYLDDDLVTDIRTAGFVGDVPCGAHKVGVRILYDNAWSGIKEFLFYTCKTLTTSVISGPSTLNAGQSATYTVIVTFSDGTTGDLTSSYTFSSAAGGSFAANVFTAGDNPLTEPSSVTITATKSGSDTLTKVITINNPSAVNAGVLTVEFFAGNIGKVLSYISTYGVTYRGVEAYSSSNFVPIGADPADAVILAPDIIPGDSGIANIAFEFNLKKLQEDNPLFTAFSFAFEGNVINVEYGVHIEVGYFTKNQFAEMTMTGEPGSYIPSTIGGAPLNNAGGLISFIKTSEFFGTVYPMFTITYDVTNNIISWVNQF